ncbi:MarR family winged helix-turn-helix transcriptional regulator [Streptomyces avicenniae]|uniref:MarR family winged helix-turn-helix transcriptional regulator n=1 Tax=Streptomyces avicenniae TaxID=500153 RepID=UPI00069BE161|nr:MarR family transcriptional regulator [Streptomyces avicenniae]
MDERDIRWLDDDERSAWLALVSTVVRLPAALDAQLRRDAGISHFEYQVMAGLSTAPGRTQRMSDLARCSDGSLSRLSHTVRRLEERGWVRRRADPDDGRCTLAVLTDDGWEKVAATAPGHVAEVRRLVLDPLTTAQLGQLREIGRRVNEAIGPDPALPPVPRDASPPTPPSPPTTPGLPHRGTEAPS